MHVFSHLYAILMVSNLQIVIAMYLTSSNCRMVQPRNYLLLACHASNEVAQLYQLQRALRA